MKQFFITFAAVIAAGIVLTIVPTLIFMVMMTAALMAGSGTSAKPGTILKFDISEPITDRDMDTPAMRAQGFLYGEDNTTHGLNTLRDNLYAAAEDPNIVALMLTGGSVNANFADMRDIRRAIQEFKETSGKPVYYYANSMSDGATYVASAADSVFVTPNGSVLMMGCTSSKIYFKRMADKFGVGFDVIKHGKYKSAVEPYFRESMSPEDREQTMRYLDVIWSEERDSIAAGRKIKPEAVDAYVDELKGLSGSVGNAVEAGLIDAGIYYDQFEGKLRQIAGIGANEELKISSIFDYEPKDDGAVSKQTDKIAIVYAEGQIYDGKGNNDDANIYGDKLAKTLRDIRADKDIKAVVMRVNSPGGSASASDIIWREVELLKKEKTVVVSMGGYAASGGYYISCAANHIVAEPNTITGSIGVFGVVPNGAKLIDNLGVDLDVVSTSKNPLVTGFSPLSAPVYAALSNSVEETYKNFASRVAAGRDLPYETVDSLGGGRVWTGVDALTNGLVDELGNLDDAIDVAAEMAGLSNDYVTEDYPKLDDSMTAAMKMLGLSARLSISKALFSDLYNEQMAAQFDNMKARLNSPDGFVWAVCDVEVR